jgi:hypothetical protein
MPHRRPAFGRSPVRSLVPPGAAAPHCTLRAMCTQCASGTHGPAAICPTTSNGHHATTNGNHAILPGACGEGGGPHCRRRGRPPAGVGTGGGRRWRARARARRGRNSTHGAHREQAEFSKCAMRASGWPRSCPYEGATPGPHCTIATRAVARAAENPSRCGWGRGRGEKGRSRLLSLN